jgi:peptidoglycan/LPS O-acetylase OafA/YrhL
MRRWPDAVTERIQERFGYHPALDGVRAAAITAVVGVYMNLLPGGGIGVLVFFVLSGFLITSLLFDERQQTGRISLRRFYARRALRLLPALVLVVIAAALVALAMPGNKVSGATLRFIPAALFYYGNWIRAAHSYFTGGTLAHTWSLSVEEQFYILWAIFAAGLLASGARLRTLALLALAGAALSDLGKYLVWAGGTIDADANRMYGTDLSGDGLMLGCALAAAVRCRPTITARIADWAVGPAVVYLLCVAAFVHPFAGGFTGSHRFEVYMWPGCNVAAAVLVAHVVLSSRSYLARALSLAPIRFLGRISYGVYLWHYPIIYWLLLWFNFRNAWWQVIIEAGMTLAVSVASYQLVERRALRLKTRLEPRSRPGIEASALATTPVGAETI